MSTSNRRTIRVALAGVTGAGKSTLVNVLSGSEKAWVNNDVKPCTTKATPYEVVKGDTTYCIWDTRGFNEASEPAASFSLIRLRKFFGKVPNADRELEKLLRDGNPDLVLLCFDMKKIGVREHWKNYNKVYVDLGNKKVKVAVVVTQMGERDFKDSTCKWKRRCRDGANGIVEEFPAWLDFVPKFENLDDKEVKECKNRILTLISNACPRKPMAGVEQH